MYIHRAHSGVKFYVDVDANITVDRLKELCVGPSGVPKEDQILLCQTNKLERQKTLGHYGLPSDTKSVFLFDKRLAEADAPIPDEVILPPIELKVTPAPPLPREQELERSPLLWELLKYENQFLNDLNTAEAMKKVVDARTDICKSCISEQETQTRGLEAAVANLTDQFNQIIVAHKGFQDYSNAAFSKHEKYLQSFNSDMQRLKDIKLHPGLVRQGVNVLMDCVPEAKLWKWAEECKSEHVSLQSFVSELEKQIAYLRESVDEEQRKPLDVDFNKLRTQFKRANDISVEVTLRYQIFSNDYNNIKQTVEQAKMARQLHGGICDGFEDIKYEHSRYLNAMHEHDKTIQSIMSECASSKTRLSRNVHERLRSISLFQSKIREQANKILLYNEALQRQKAAFQQLAYVHSMPTAYRSSLEEVSRRRKWKKSIYAFQTKINETLTKSREEETQKRSQFLSSFGRYIPKDLIPGLTQELPLFQFDLTKNIDSALPLIDTDHSNSNSEEEDQLSLLFSALGEEKSQRLQELEKENEKLLQQIKIISSSQNTSGSPPVHNQIGMYGGEGFGRSRSHSEVGNDPSGDYRNRIEVLESKLSSTYSQIEKAETMVKQYKTKCEVAEQQLIEISKTTDDKTLHHEEMMRQIDQLRDQSGMAEVLDKKLKKTESDLEETMKQMKELETMSVLAVEEKSRLERENFDLKDQLEATNETLKEQANLLKELEARLKNSSQSLRNLQEEMTHKSLSLEESEDAKEKEIANLKLELSKTLENLQEISNQNENLQNSKEKLREDVQRLEKSAEDQASSLQELEQTLNAERDQFTVQIASLTSQNEEREQEIEDLRIVINEIRKKSDQLKEQKESLSLELQRLASEKDQTFEEQLNNYKQNSLVLEEQLEKAKGFKSELEKCKSELEKVRKEKKEFEKVLKESQSESERLKNESERIKNELERSKTELEQERQQKASEGLKSSQLFEENARSLGGQVQQMRITIEQNERNLSEKEKALETTKGEYISLREKYLEMVKRLEAYRKGAEETAKSAKEWEDDRKRLKAENDYLKQVQSENEHAIRQHNEAIRSVTGAGNVMRDRIKALEMALEGSEKKCQHYQEEMESFKFMAASKSSGPMIPQLSRPNIAVSKFKVDDWMLFIEKNGHYEAWNKGEPHYYLSPAVIEALDHKSKDPILAQAIEITPNRANVNENPFELPSGTHYHEVLATVEELA